MKRKVDFAGQTDFLKTLVESSENDPKIDDFRLKSAKIAKICLTCKTSIWPVDLPLTVVKKIDLPLVIVEKNRISLKIINLRDFPDFFRTFVN